MVQYEGLIANNRQESILLPLTWEQRIEKIPGVLAINKDTLSFLPRILERFEGDDPYMMCPSYHAFTGRYGLWAYYKDRSLLLMAKNPANKEQILFFPQLGDSAPHLALDIIDNMPQPKGGYRFSRIPTEQANFMAAILNKRSKTHSFNVIREDLLDWTYPVHVISTEKVINPSGRQMKNFRLHMAKIDQTRITVKPFNASSDIPELMSIVDQWAKNKARALDYDEMMEIYRALFELVLHPALNLMGIKIYYDGELKAYEIWDMPKEKNGIANSFAGFSNAQIYGFSEFQHYALCKTLHEAGIKEVCLGGSEIEGLDAFKRKMRPVRSICLSSIDVVPSFAKKFQKVMS